LLWSVIEAVPEEVAKQRIVGKRVPLGFDFLAGEDMHDCRQGGLGGIGVGTGRIRGRDAARCDRLLNRDSGWSLALPDPVRAERADDEQDRHRHRDSLSKDHPQAMHRKICHRERAHAR
jgi:hypothetical protein